jgi:hypothetical protein
VRPDPGHGQVVRAPGQARHKKHGTNDAEDSLSHIPSFLILDKNLLFTRGSIRIWVLYVNLILIHKMRAVAHLVGDNSVIDLLRKRGYKVVKLQK